MSIGSVWQSEPVDVRGTTSFELHYSLRVPGGSPPTLTLRAETSDRHKKCWQPVGLPVDCASSGLGRAVYPRAVFRYRRYVRATIGLSQVGSASSVRVLLVPRKDRRGRKGGQADRPV